jgi:cell division septation protein DedD
VEISKYIKDLLQDNDCVVIPDLGGFVIISKSAKISDTKSSFSPPSKELIFDSKLEKDDGLLRKYIAETAKMSEQQAKNEINNFVTQAKDKLQKGEKVSFDEIGSLQLDANKNIRFKVDADSHFLMDTFGLMEFKSQPVPEISTTNQDTEEDQGNDKSGTIVILGVAAAVIIFLVIFAYTKGYFDFITGKQTADSEEVIYQPDEEIEADKENDSPELDDPDDILIIEDDTTGSGEPPTSTEESTTESTPNSGTTYYIIAGSFTNLENAKVRKAALDNAGYSATILEKENGYYRISIASFGSEQQAKNKLDELNQNNAIKDMWIHKK